MKVAALDLGTNTFLCLIAEVEGGRVVRVYDDQVRLVRLGQDVDKNRFFHPDALTRAKIALTEFSEIIQKEQPGKVLAMATSAARDVQNGEELFRIGTDLHIPIHIIPGSREAEITFKGAVSGTNDHAKRLVIDVGGGSTELIVGQGKEYRTGQSLDLGCVRLTEKFGMKTPLEKDHVEEVSNHIRAQLQHVVRTLVGFVGGVDEILAVAGTPTELARIEIGDFIPEKIEGFTLTKAKLQDWVEKFRTSSSADIADKLGVHPGRADVILIGAMILLETLNVCEMNEMKVSTRGVRYGVALEMESM